MVKLGQEGFDFILKDKQGKEIQLAKIKADYIVVYFYPKDSTPGCTLEANTFNELLPEFKKLKTEVIGISGGDEKSKEKFSKKYGLKLTLLSDPEFFISRQYYVYGEKKFLGKTFMGIKRTTFILDKNKKFIKIYENVKPDNHAKEVLTFLTELKRPKRRF